MPRYRNQLPQLSGDPYLTDGGLETTLIFHDGLELPDFAAFHLLGTEAGDAAMLEYFRTYGELARRYGVGFILESPTWRSSPDWGTRLGYSADALADANRAAIAMMEQIREEFEDDTTKIVISGCVGPRGDGYGPEELLSPADAEAYHSTQINTFAGTKADMVTAITMTHAGEAIGIVRAARAAGMPSVISFTVETDGALPDGTPLGDAIETVDSETGAAAAYFMLNCAHPAHFHEVLEKGGDWRSRIRGLRANASMMSHAELDEAEELDAGDPADLAERYVAIQSLLPINVLGGCCGTDHRHVDAIFRACVAA